MLEALVFILAAPRSKKEYVDQLLATLDFEFEF